MIIEGLEISKTELHLLFVHGGVTHPLDVFAEAEDAGTHAVIQIHHNYEHDPVGVPVELIYLVLERAIGRAFGAQLEPHAEWAPSLHPDRPEVELLRARVLAFL